MRYISGQVEGSLKPPVLSRKPASPSREQQKVQKQALAESRSKTVGALKIPVRKDYNLVNPPLATKNQPPGIFGLLINPRNSEVIFAARTMSAIEKWTRDIKIYRTGTAQYLGGGYFDDEHDFMAYAEATTDPNFTSDATGYPRVHVSHGVVIPRQGYGTALYTALCLAAHLNWTRRLRFYVNPSGIYDGISSSPASRSEDADTWWDTAMFHGIAYQVEACAPYIEKLDPCEICNIYEYRLAFEKQYVIAWTPRLPKTLEETSVSDWAYDGKMNGELTTPGNRIALRNANLCKLSPSVFGLLFDLAERSGATSAELQAMKFRYETQTDCVSKPSGSLSSGLRWHAAGLTEEGLRELRDTPSMHAEYERLAHERAELGWSFMDD